MIRSSLLWAALLVAVPACGNVPSSSDAGSVGPDASPADPDGGIDAMPVTCEPSTTVCDDATDELTVCDATGQGSVQRCALGCREDVERCTDVAPSNGLAAYLDMTTSGPSVDIPDGSVIETAAGTIVSSAGPIVVPSFVVEQVGAPSIRVFVVPAATIGDVTINGASAFAMVADGPIVIEGRMSVGARGTIAGAGARMCSVRDGRGGDGVHSGNTGYVFPGGGGGALVGDPGRGGDVALSSSGPPFQGGAAGIQVNAATLVPLRGGCAGGGTNYPDQTGIVQVGSGGGGAVQLVSRTQISLVAGDRGIGLIDVGGGGGQPGPNNSTGNSGGGGGGGSGGGVLIEAPAVLITGNGVAIAAKGGGGGGGCTGAGADGGTAAMPARGGDCGGSTALTSGGDGGVVVYGGAVTAARPGVNTTALSGNRASGGGGGSHGVVRINTATGQLALGAGAAIYAATTIGEIGRR
jgi:hypothetical protein